MPKYGIHQIVLRSSINKLRDMEAEDSNLDPDIIDPGGEEASAADIITENMSSAVLGSIGPDIFFWGPDYEIVEKLHSFYQKLEGAINVYNEVVGPIKQIGEAVGDATEELVGSLAPSALELIKTLLAEIEETSNLFQSTIATGIFAGVIEGVDLLNDITGLTPKTSDFFMQFVPEYQQNIGEEMWYWFDMLHYRKTGEFAKNLVEKAVTPRQKAFAFGYLSHIACDVTGHAFVNQVSGTTYRLNVQRHVIAENFMDTWMYDQQYGESINKTLFERLKPMEVLPHDIRDLLYDAFYDTYQSDTHPTRLGGDGFYTKTQIMDTYDVFYDVLQLMSSTHIERPEEPFSEALDILEDALNNLSLPPSPSNGSDGTSSMCSWKDIFSFGRTESSRACYENFFKEVRNYLEYLGELLVWAFETILALIDIIIAALLYLPITALLAILYGIQLLCYEVYRTARWTLVLNGFVLPEPDELETSVARNLITPNLCQILDAGKIFPSVGQPIRNCLVCPSLISEQPYTDAGFHPEQSTPDEFAFNIPFNIEALTAYANSLNPEETLDIQKASVCIGNATDFTAWLIKNANDDIEDEIKNVVYANWNLDSDRGYGYLSWKGVIPDDEPWIVQDEHYVDREQSENTLVATLLGLLDWFWSSIIRLINRLFGRARRS